MQVCVISDSKGLLPVPEKKKNSPNQERPSDEIEDAVILNDPADDRDQPSKAAAGDEAEAENPPSQQEEEISQEDPVKDDAAEASLDKEAESALAEQETPDTETHPADDGAPDELKTEKPVSTEQVVIRKGGFFPMLLGGVAAAAIGFGLARSGVLEGMPLPGLEAGQSLLTEIDDRTKAQQTLVSDLQARIAALEAAPQPQAMLELPDFAPAIDDLTTQIGVLAGRIDALEARPIAEGAAVDPQAQVALADARAELDQIRTALAAQQAQIATLSDEAAQAEAQAQLSAQAAMTRAAVTRIVTALDAGTGYTEALNDLSAANVEVPTILLEQADTGVPTLAALQADFPDLARDALRAARQAQNPGGIGGFFETQLGLRSLQPREGDDPDAILSRAEAALRDGRLSDTLAEIARLPEEAATVLADWQAQAQMRVTLTDAARDLAQSLNTN